MIKSFMFDKFEYNNDLNLKIYIINVISYFDFKFELINLFDYNILIDNFFRNKKISY